MGIKNIEFIVEELILGGLCKDTKCAVIQEASLKNQKCFIEKLDNLADKIKAVSYTHLTLPTIALV